MQKVRIILFLILLVIPVCFGEVEILNRYSDKEGNNLKIYSYQKYYDRDGIYEEINESFYRCREGYCTDEYNYKVVVSNDSKAVLTSRRKRGSIKFISFLGQSPFNMEANNSIVNFDIIRDYVKLEYQYLPDRLLKRIILNKSIMRDSQWISQGNIPIRLKIEKDNVTLGRPWACDERNCTFLLSNTAGNDYNIYINGRWIGYENRSEIIIIDPDIEVLNTNASYNAIVRNLSSMVFGGYEYRLNENPTNLRYGVIHLCTPFCPAEFDVYRTAIEMNITGLPEGIGITGIDLVMNSKRVADNYKNHTMVEFYNMEHNHTYYQFDNKSFYTDMGNGTKYHVHNVTTLGIYVFDLINASEYLLNETGSTFNIGFRSQFEYVKGATIRDGRFSPNREADKNLRPYLNITYYYLESEDANIAKILTFILIFSLWFFFVFFKYYSLYLDKYNVIFDIGLMIFGISLGLMIMRDFSVITGMGILGITLLILYYNK